MKRLLIANRGEIAIRIARAAGELGIESVMVYADDDARALHVTAGDTACELGAGGPGAYLDIDSLVETAQRAGADAVHPGYGFLSESAAFARAVNAAGLVFVGPTAEQLDLFGSKPRARDLAASLDVPLLRATPAGITPEDARAFLRDSRDGAIILKAVAGGGGRGTRIVRAEDEIDAAFARCTAEGEAAFGDGRLFAEDLMAAARHVEVQLVGDGRDVIHLHERDCTLQRHHQKLIEIAPAPGLAAPTRAALTDAALRMAEASAYQSLATFEFLVEAGGRDAPQIAFIETNPRLQVEHTVTEAVLGLDLVALQLRLAGGETLEAQGLTQDTVPEPRGNAIQARINMERLDADGNLRPTSGTLTAFEQPGGPGVRVDTFGYAGYKTSTRFDSLLAKLIIQAPTGGLDSAMARARRALEEFRIEGVETNRGLLATLLLDETVQAGQATTRYVDDHAAALSKAAHAWQARFVPAAGDIAAQDMLAGGLEAGEGELAVTAPLQGLVIAVDVEAGQSVLAGQRLALLDAMKMEHLVEAPEAGTVIGVAVAPDSVVDEAETLFIIAPSGDDGAARVEAAEPDPDHIRPDLGDVLARQGALLDEARPDAVEKRRKRGHRTARENVEDLVDPGSFREYGGFALAAQRRRRPLEELERMSPADGLVTGLASVNGDQFEPAASRCMVVAYDYTVLAGTQGMMNHQKKDRAFKLAEDWRVPVILFAEGGGGRPGDTDAMGVAGLDVPTFASYARLSGSVPLISVVAGRCFAGNAALAGCSDVIIATRDTTLGMGGPAMIEGGGLGVYAPEEVGPVSVQSPNGVIDLVVEDEAEAVVAARQYLSYFQGELADWTAPDPRRLRHMIPENRLRVYDIRRLVDALCDAGSVLELRGAFAPGMITALVRIEGKPFGLIANNPMHLSGAIDAAGADKAARFMQLCEAFGLPILSLCDTPGFMVGPETEATAQVRHVSRMFVTGANLTVPLFTVVLRKGYGLGAQSMAGGGFHEPVFIVSWPTGEFGGMGLEGAVRLGYRKEMEAIADPDAREAYYREKVDQMYERGKAVNMAAFLEIDAVIDPAETRAWVMRGLASLPARRTGAPPRPFIDTW